MEGGVIASTAAVLSIIVNAQTSQATAALARVDKQLKGTAAGANAAQTGVGRMGKAAEVAGKVGAAALAYGLYKSIRVGMDFEKQMSSLQAVTNASGSQMSKFERQAMDMAKGTIFGAREVAQAQTELAKAGQTPSQILGGSLKSALDLAAAGEMDLAQAANTAANAMNLFNIPARKSGQVADMLATAANTTTAEVADFAMALTQGGSAAKQVGFSLNDTVVVLEALAQAGIKNSDAGTSMKTALLQLAAPTERQTQLAHKLGLEFFNQAGEMKNPIKLAGELQRELGGMSKAQRTAALKVLAGTDGFRTLAALYDLGATNARKLADANRETGTAQEVAREKTNNLAGDLERLQGALETKGIEVFQDIEPQLRSIAGVVTDVIEGMPDINWGDLFGDPITVANRWAGKVGQAIGTKIRQAMAAVGNVASKGANIALSVGGDAVGKARQVWAAVRGIVSRAISFILSIPRGAISAARAVWNAVKGAISRGINFVLSLPAVGGLVSAARSIWNAINSALPDITINIDIPTPSLPDIPKLASGSDRFGGGLAMVNERGPELARMPNGAMQLLAGGRRNAMVNLPRDAQVFTASETRRLLKAGIPGFAKGKKKPKAKATGNPYEAALAAAELTAGLGDDINAVNALIGYWQRQAAKYSKPVKMAGKRGKAMDWSKLTEARQQIKSYQEMLADLLGGSSDTASADSTLSDLYKGLAVFNAQRFAVSQAQYGVLAGGLPPFAGSFATGGPVPGPIGQPVMIQAHGGETVVPTQGRMEFVITNWRDGTGYLRSIAGQEVGRQGRRMGRGVNRTPGNAGALQ